LVRRPRPCLFWDYSIPPGLKKLVTLSSRAAEASSFGVSSANSKVGEASVLHSNSANSEKEENKPKPVQGAMYLDISNFQGNN
jgi:hypothetical protein